MVRLRCADCGAGISKADVVCRHCGSSLLDDDSVVVVPADAGSSAEQPRPPLDQTRAQPVADVASAEEEAGSPARQCPECGADIPDPRHLVCVHCMAELRPLDGRAGPSADGHPQGDAPDMYATVHERNGGQLVVTFEFGAIQLRVGQEVLLGRDSPDHRLAALRSMDNVSRIHATIGLSAEGAWVRDERSTNGTYVNGQPVVAGAVVQLPAHAELRLASNVRATVQLRRADHG